MGHGNGRGAALALVMMGALGLFGAPAVAAVQAPAPTATPSGQATPDGQAEATSEGTEDAPATSARATVTQTLPKAGVVVTDAATGTVFSDTNGNGARDAGEAALPDAPVTLQGNGRVRSAVTGQDGGYTLGDLPAGTYTLTVEPTGYQALSRSVIAAGGTSTSGPGAPASSTRSTTTTPASNDATALTGTVTFRSKPVAAGLTFSRPGRADVTVRSDDAGRYTASLAPGDYTVKITVPELLQDVVTLTPHTVAVAGTAQTHDVALQARERDCTTSDFSSVSEAQAVYDRLKPQFGDVFDLDGDNDGKVCERGLSGTGGGGTASSGTRTSTAARATAGGTSAKALARTGTETAPATLLAAGLIAAGAALRVTSLHRRATRVRVER